MTDKIAVIGAGSWGTANARLFALKGFHVGLWAREPEVVESIRDTGHNLYYLTEVELPLSYVSPTSDLEQALTGAADEGDFALCSDRVEDIIDSLSDGLQLSEFVLGRAPVSVNGVAALSTLHRRPPCSYLIMRATRRQVSHAWFHFGCRLGDRRRSPSGHARVNRARLTGRHERTRIHLQKIGRVKKPAPGWALCFLANAEESE